MRNISLKEMFEMIIECKWLNKNFGDGYWICDGFLKRTNEEICKDCLERKK